MSDNPSWRERWRTSPIETITWAIACVAAGWGLFGIIGTGYSALTPEAARSAYIRYGMAMAAAALYEFWLRSRSRRKPQLPKTLPEIRELWLEAYKRGDVRELDKLNLQMAALGDAFSRDWLTAHPPPLHRGAASTGWLILYAALALFGLMLLAPSDVLPFKIVAGAATLWALLHAISTQGISDTADAQAGAQIRLDREMQKLAKRMAEQTELPGGALPPQPPPPLDDNLK